MHLVSCGLWELHSALIQSSQDQCRFYTPLCCQFGVLSSWLRSFQHSGSILWENVQISPTKNANALGKLPVLNHNCSVEMKQYFPWDFLIYFSFMCLLKCEIVCGKDLGAFFLLTLSEQPVFIYIITFAVRIGNEPFNGREMGTGWYVKYVS